MFLCKTTLNFDNQSMSTESKVTRDVSTMPVQIYEAGSKYADIRFKLGELKKHRYLLTSLVQRDLKSRYKNSVLGILWSLLNPLALMIVFTLVFTVLSNGGTQRQHPVFLLTGLLPWNFFSSTVMVGTLSIVGSSSLIKKVYFPRELLPASAMLSNFVNFLISLIILVFFLYAYRIGLTIHALWVVPLIITQMLFSMGLVLALSAITVFYRDVLMILDVVMLAWFFMTPVFYPFETYADVGSVLGVTFSPAQFMRWVNPMASLIDGYRTVLWGTTSSDGPVGMDPAYFIRTFITAVIVFLIGYIIFARTEHVFGEKL